MDMSFYLAEKRRNDREERKEREDALYKILIPVIAFMSYLTLFFVWWFR